MRDADVRQLNSTLTRDLVYAIAALNGLAPQGPRRAPQFQLNAQEQEDLTVYAEALPRLVSIGVQPTVKWAHEKLGIPVPQDGEAVLALQPGLQAGPLGDMRPATLRAAWQALPGGALASAAAAPAAPQTPQTPPLAMAGQLAQRAAPAVDAWVRQVRELVARAESLQDIRDGLQTLLPELTLDEYAAAMAEALAAAQLAGRYEVLQEAGGRGG